MTHVVNRRNSIYFQLLKLLVLALSITIIFFFCVDYAATLVVDKYYATIDYEAQEDRKHVADLQAYIDEYDLASTDKKELKEWMNNQRYLSVHIYKGNKSVFDSVYPSDYESEDETGYTLSSESTYDLTFRDGNAKIGISGFYPYSMYDYCIIVSGIIAFILFLVIVLCGIRRKIKYIARLSQEIKILEGGSLDYAITVKGKDELATLASGVDEMRVSFKRMMNSEAQMIKDNQAIITEMSHDIRTPITSIMLYTEILKQGKYKDEQQLREYIEKIDEKAMRMKQLTDNLFEYSLVTGKKEVELEDPESFEALFYDIISETCSYLEHKGFSIELDMDWPEDSITICTDYIFRVFDNITSNIIKYANSKEPIIISTVRSNHFVGLSFSNKIKDYDEAVESSHVGLQSINNMMEKMNGKCNAVNDNDRFYIEFLFPTVEK